MDFSSSKKNGFGQNNYASHRFEQKICREIWQKWKSANLVVLIWQPCDIAGDRGSFFIVTSTIGEILLESVNNFHLKL